MDSIAGKIKLGDKIKCQASGPQIVVAPGADGVSKLQMGWQFTLWLEHNRLLGQEPVGVSAPVGIEALGGDMVPPAAILEGAVKAMLDKAREIRSERESLQQLPTAEDVLAAMRNLSRS